jgi:hypothetical protein
MAKSYKPLSAIWAVGSPTARRRLKNPVPQKRPSVTVVCTLNQVWECYKNRPDTFLGDRGGGAAGSPPSGGWGRELPKIRGGVWEGGGPRREAAPLNSIKFPDKVQPNQVTRPIKIQRFPGPGGPDSPLLGPIWGAGL